MSAIFNNTARPVAATDRIKIGGADQQYQDVGAMQIVANSLPIQHVTVTGNNTAYVLGDQCFTALLEPTANFSNVTVTMPANPWDGQTTRIVSAGNYTTFTQGVSGTQTIGSGNLTGNITTSTKATFVFDATGNGTWYQVS